MTPETYAVVFEEGFEFQEELVHERTSLRTGAVVC